MAAARTPGGLPFAAADIGPSDPTEIPMNTTTIIEKCRKCGAVSTHAATCTDCGATQTSETGRTDTLTRIRNGLVWAAIIVVAANIGVALIEPTPMKTVEPRRAHVEADFYWDAETTPHRRRLVGVVEATWPKVPGCQDIDPGTLSYSPSRTASFGKGPTFFVTCINPAGIPFNYWFTLDGEILDWQRPK